MSLGTFAVEFEEWNYQHNIVKQCGLASNSAWRQIEMFVDQPIFYWMDAWSNFKWGDKKTQGDSKVWLETWHRIVNQVCFHLRTRKDISWLITMLKAKVSQTTLYIDTSRSFWVVLTVLQQRTWWLCITCSFSLSASFCMLCSTYYAFPTPLYLIVSISYNTHQAPTPSPPQFPQNSPTPSHHLSCPFKHSFRGKRGSTSSVITAASAKHDTCSASLSSPWFY